MSDHGNPNPTAPAKRYTRSRPRRVLKGAKEIYETLTALLAPHVPKSRHASDVALEIMRACAGTELFIPPEFANSNFPLASR